MESKFPKSPPEPAIEHNFWKYLQRFNLELKNQLSLMGESIVADVVTALADARFWRHRYARRSKTEDESALSVLLYLLEPYGPQESGAHLVRLLRSVNKKSLRCQLAFALGNIAGETFGAEIKKLLDAKEPDDVARSLLKGIGAGVLAGAASSLKGSMPPLGRFWQSNWGEIAWRS